MTRNPPSGEARYTKEQLLSIFQALREAAALDANLPDLFSGAWDPVNDTNGVGSQEPGNEARDYTPGPEVCWQYGEGVEPLNLTAMTEEEKLVWKTSLSR